MRATGVRLHNFRNYERAQIELPPGLTMVHGSVGAGKTNLLEAVYLGCVGRSPRTGNDRELVRFGEASAAVSLSASNSTSEHRYDVLLEPGRPKVLKVDGTPRERLGEAVQRPLVCVFMPDRLALVKGPAVHRRAHLDSLVAALWPARHRTRIEYGRALAQRNALLGRIRAGVASSSSLAGWGSEVARLGFELTSDRARAIEALEPLFEKRALELALPVEARLRYRPSSRSESAAELATELEARVDSDVERGFTTHGPHRDDFSFEVGGRDLRRYGSQGQQRLGLLSLLLAERELLWEVTGDPPLLLLDDVLSELDATRRSLLLDSVRESGQTLLTTADPVAARAAGSLSEILVEEGSAGG